MMSNLKNIELAELEVVELNATEMQEIEGGLWPLIFVLAAGDAALWGYILW